MPNSFGLQQILMRGMSEKPAPQQQEILGRIEAINDQVTPLEREFSATLGQAARWIREVLRGSVVRDVLRRTRNIDVHVVRRPSA